MELEYVKEIGKGILIGIANVVPGVSGGTLAVSMGIYDKILRAVTHLFSETRKSILTLLPYGAGAGLGVVFLSFLVERLFGAFPLQTGMAFLGLIAGGLPGLYQKVRGRSADWRCLAAFSGALGFVVCITLWGGESAGTAGLGLRPGQMLSLFCVGLLAAASMVAPGVSGSMLLMMLGYYRPILRAINGCAGAFLDFDLPACLRYGLLLAPFAAGVAAGVFLFAKLVEFLLDKWETIVYFAVMGLVISSPVVVLHGIRWSGVEEYQMLAGTALFLGAGALVSGLNQ